MNVPGSKILFVDDEDKVLKALKRSLLKESYHCRFATSGPLALEMLAHQPADVLVSDMRMPKMDGVELLSIVASLYPQTMRVVLSGQTHSDTILDAVNQGEIFRYITKPWDDRELFSILRQALEVKQLQDEKRQLMASLEQHNRELEKQVEKRTAQVLKMSNMAEIGKYASQIVHDLNNPLHAVSAAIDLLRKSIAHRCAPDLNDMGTWLDMAKRNVHDLKSIISGILLHARDQSRFDVGKVDINTIIEQELKFFELDPDFKDSVDKDVGLDEALPAVSGHPVQIKQVVGNLIRNAWDAMINSDTKRLTIRTKPVNGWVVIKIGDTGEGIQSEDMDRIFNPDFTTKPIGRGTGLGLASVQTMIQAYAGKIEVASHPGQGTMFTIKLPQNNQPMHA